MNYALALNRVKILLGRSFRGFSEDQGTAMAAAISYYVLFSLFPLLIFAIGVLGIVIQDERIRDELIDMVLEYIPVEDGIDEQLVSSIERIELVGSSAFGLIGLLGMAWSGSNMFAIIRRTLNVAFNVNTPRPFVRQKLADFAMMGMVGVIFLASLTVTVLLRATEARAADLPVLGTLSESLGWGWTVASFFIPVLVSLAAFFLIYWFLPATKVRARDAIIGAFCAAVSFELGKMGFSIYLENFDNFNAIYGSVGAVVIFLFWVFISSNILLFFGEMTAELPEVLAGEHDREGVPTADSLLPWHVKLRRISWRVIRSLIFYEPDDDRRRPT